MQILLLFVETRLHEHLQREWRAHTNILKYDPESSEFLSFPEWPTTLRDVVGARWNDERRVFEATTLGKFMVSPASLESPIVLVGAPATHKTYTANNIARVLCVQTGKSKYLSSSNLDDWGNLSAQGHVDEAACSIMDDCPVLTEKGRPLTQTEIVSLFTTRTTSSYGARYHPATFPVLHIKIFLFNLDTKKDAQDHDEHSFPKVCPWFLDCAKACNPVYRACASRRMEEAPHLQRAQARRPTVFVFDKSPYTNTTRQRMAANDGQVMAERMARMRTAYGTEECVLIHSYI
jgi:hypothetical protein